MLSSTTVLNRRPRNAQAQHKMSKSNGDKKPTVVCIVGVAGFIGSHLLEMIIRVSAARLTLQVFPPSHHAPFVDGRRSATGSFWAATWRRRRRSKHCSEREPRSLEHLAPQWTKRAAPPATPSRPHALTPSRPYAITLSRYHAITPLAHRRRSEKKWADRFEFHQMDITKEPEKLKALIAKCDTVVNLAAICNPSEYIKQPVNTIRSNYNDAQARAHCGTHACMVAGWTGAEQREGGGGGGGGVRGELPPGGYP